MLRDALSGVNEDIRVGGHLIKTVHFADDEATLASSVKGQGRIWGEGAGGCSHPPPFPEVTGSFLIQLVFCQKKTMWFIGVEVEQETSVHPLLKKILDSPLKVYNL